MYTIEIAIVRLMRSKGIRMCTLVRIAPRLCTQVRSQRRPDGYTSSSAHHLSWECPHWIGPACVSRVPFWCSLLVSPSGVSGVSGVLDLKSCNPFAPPSFPPTASHLASLLLSLLVSSTEACPPRPSSSFQDGSTENPCHHLVVRPRSPPSRTQRSE